MTGYIITIISIIGLSFSILGFIRNKQVFNLRDRIRKEIYNLQDVRESLKFFGKYDCMTYNEMMMKFFTPISKIETEWRKKLGLKRLEEV